MNISCTYTGIWFNVEKSSLLHQFPHHMKCLLMSLMRTQYLNRLSRSLQLKKKKKKKKKKKGSIGLQLNLTFLFTFFSFKKEPWLESENITLPFDDSCNLILTKQKAGPKTRCVSDNGYLLKTPWIWSIEKTAF